MSTKAGNLLWNRRRITVLDGVIDIDTGLRQVDRSFADMSPNEPNFASRIQVVPLSPISQWAGVTHGEPFLDPVTNTIHVVFSNGVTTDINVLFWNPHSILGPGEADPYGMV